MTKICLSNFVLLIICSILIYSCGLLPEKVNYHDKKIKPLLDAIAEINRDSLGFTKISENSDIKLEGASKTYDAMLHIYYNTSRTIAFRKVNGKYKWIGEQESHTGPRKFDTPDGIFNEKITITYDKEVVSGFPTNKINILYYGPDSVLTDLSNSSNLTLKQVIPIINKWDSLELKN